MYDNAHMKTILNLIVQKRLIRKQSLGEHTKRSTNPKGIQADTAFWLCTAAR